MDIIVIQYQNDFRNQFNLVVIIALNREVNNRKNEKEQSHRDDFILRYPSLNHLNGGSFHFNG